jgi:hypothetical protein
MMGWRSSGVDRRVPPHQTLSWRAVLDAVPPAHFDAWTEAFELVYERRGALSLVAPASVDLVRFMALGQGSGRNKDEVIDHVIAHGGGNPAWKIVLEHVGVSAPCSTAPNEVRAVLAAGVAVEDFRIPDELSMAALLFPDDIPDLVAAGADVRRSDALF